MPALIFILLLLLAAFLGALLCLSGLRRHRRSGGTPEGAGFRDTLRAVPLRLVIGLDLLDFGLDVFAAPLTWLLLDRAGLRALRNIASLEALVPFTQPVPLLTVCWLGVRLLDWVGVARGGNTDTPNGATPRRRVANEAGQASG